MNCPHCNNTGTATIVKKIKMNGRISEYEFGVACICRDGIFKKDLKYPNDLVLTEKEKEIYSKLKKGDIKELCPF